MASSELHELLSQLQGFDAQFGGVRDKARKLAARKKPSMPMIKFTVTLGGKPYIPRETPNMRLWHSRPAVYEETRECIKESIKKILG